MMPLSKKVAENNHQEMKRYGEAFYQQYGLDFIPSKGNFITIDFKQPAAPIYDALLREGVIVRPLHAMACQITYVSVLAYHKKMTNFLLHSLKC